MATRRIRIIGGGLAGPEAALQAAKRGCEVDLYEMRPVALTEAHQTADFARARLLQLAQVRVGEHRSLAAEAGDAAGRLHLSSPRPTPPPFRLATHSPSTASSFRGASPSASRPSRASRASAKRSRASTRTTPTRCTILATGPLTSVRRSAAEIQRLTGSDHLAFYDSISPIVDATTIDMTKVYFAARYDKGTADYINCPFTKEEYDRFLDALTTAEAVEARDGKFPATGRQRSSNISRAACRSKRLHGAVATRCASVR